MPTLPIQRSERSAFSRKKGSPAQVSSGDVPVIPSRTPGGLNVPKDAFETTLGVGAQELGPAAVEASERLRVAEEKQQNREDASAIARSSRQYRDEISNLFDQFTKESDLSLEADSKDYGRGLEKIKQVILSEFNGSEDGRARLSAKLEDMQGISVMKGAEEARRLTLANVDEEYKQTIVPFVTNISQNPTVENIREQFDNIEASAADFSGAWDPLQERIRVQNAKDTAGIAAIDTLLFQPGGLDTAAELLPNIADSLSPDVQLSQEKRIKKAFSDRKSITFEAQKAFAVQTAKNNADMNQINAVLGTAGLPALNVGGVVPTTVAVPFADGSESSGDMQKVNTLLTASHRLALAGKTALASNYMQQARFLMANSPEILNSKEMDKPLSPQNAAMLGVKVGTTMREVAGIIPPSPEEAAETKARGTARGKQSIEGEEQINFIDEARATITDLQDAIKTDDQFLPLVGAGGSLRASGQTVTGVLGDLGMREFVESVRDMVFEETDLSSDEEADLFDNPNLSVLSIMENSIGLILARLRTPSGRIPVDVIKRSIADVGLTGLKSEQQVQNRLNFVLKQLDRRRSSIEKRFNLGEPEKNQGSAVPDFKVVNGKVVPANEAVTTKKKAPKKKTQKEREQGRVKILEAELAAEQELLRNATNKNDIERHRGNIKAIEKELS